MLLLVVAVSLNVYATDEGYDSESDFDNERQTFQPPQASTQQNLSEENWRAYKRTLLAYVPMCL